MMTKYRLKSFRALFSSEILVPDFYYLKKGYELLIMIAKFVEDILVRDMD